MANFGEGLGQFIGSEIGASDLSSAQGDVKNTANAFGSNVAPYNTFGQSFLNPATDTVGKLETKAGQTLGYEDFMKGYQTSPGAQYQMQMADEAQNNSAAAKGGLLSGTNLRELSSINQGISNTYANQAYGSYLQGNQTQFGQLSSILGDMFKGIGVGETATGQQAGVESSQMSSQAQLAQAQAKNDQGKGSGLGSMFSGLGSMALAF